MLHLLGLVRRAAASVVLLQLLRTVEAVDFSSLSTTPPATCKRLIDADSPFISSLSLLAGVGGVGATFSDPSTFASLDHSLPLLSQCVAQLQPLSILASLATASPLSPQCMSDVTSLSNATLVDANGTIHFGDALCPAFTKLAPCLTDVFVPALNWAMTTSTNGCCDPLLASIEASFGAPLQPAITTLVHVLGNAFCSERSTLSDFSAPPENCGDSLVDNWLPLVEGDDESAYWNLLNSFQIPNGQVCQAARSEPFNTTLNETEQYGGPNIKPYGLCYTPMDALQQYVRALPLWHVMGGSDTAAMVERVFAADSCLPGADFLAWATDDDAAFMKGVRMIDDLTTVLSGDRTNTSASPTMVPLPTTSEPTNAPTSEPTNAPTTEPTTEPSSGSNDASNSDDKGSQQGEEEAPGVFDGGDPTDNGNTDDNADGPTVEELAGSNWTEIVRSKLWELNLVADQLCLHIPNGVSCSFPGDLLNVPFPQFDPTSIESGTGSGTVPSPSAPSPNSSSSSNSSVPTATPTPTPNATASNSTSTNSSGVMSMRERHNAALTAVVFTTLTALVVQLV